MRPGGFPARSAQFRFPRPSYIATRSLRRLVEEGTSFRGLVHEVRQTLAEELLLTSQMKLVEIAARLGHAEPSTFISAFKRWKGVSPTLYRRLKRGAGDTT